MTRTLLLLLLAVTMGGGCNRGVCGNDDDMEPPADDDTSSGDDDDETAGDDDTGFAPCDDDTADGTWIAAYAGPVQLDVARTDGLEWSMTCDAQATMAGHAHSFTGAIDCGDPLFAPLPLTLDGRKSGYGSCIDGEILGDLVDLGMVVWPWLGDITSSNVDGQITIDTDDLTVHGELDLTALPLALVWVNPDTGYVTGGIHVTLFGAGFTAADDMTVLFGDRSATLLEDCGNEECLVAIPAADLAGPVDVTVTNSNGTVTLTGGFTYLGS